MNITDDQIAAMCDDDRYALMRRLSSAQSALRKQRQVGNRRRRIALVVTGVCTALLVPWIGYLAATLPTTYVATSSATTWVGFDNLLVVLLALTAVFAWRRMLLVVLTSFATGALLLADAWFDITTSDGAALHTSVLAAIFVEGQLALFLMGISLNITIRISHFLHEISGIPSGGGWRAELNNEIVEDEEAVAV